MCKHCGKAHKGNKCSLLNFEFKTDPLEEGVKAFKKLKTDIRVPWE